MWGAPLEPVEHFPSPANKLAFGRACSVLWGRLWSLQLHALLARPSWIEDHGTRKSYPSRGPGNGFSRVLLQPLCFALLRLLGLCAILLTALHRSRSIHCWQDLRSCQLELLGQPSHCTAFRLSSGTTASRKSIYFFAITFPTRLPKNVWQHPSYLGQKLGKAGDVSQYQAHP